MIDILNPIKERRSVMAFAPEAISESDLLSIFNAAILAPSAYNEQPWLFYVANRSNPQAFDMVLNSLASANQLWAKNAGALIVTAAKKNYTQNGEVNRYNLHDLGMATAMLLLQAQHLGYVTHMMGGFNHAEISRALHLHNDIEIGAVIALGKHGDVNGLSPQQRERELAPRFRNDLSKVLVII